MSLSCVRLSQYFYRYGNHEPNQNACHCCGVKNKRNPQTRCRSALRQPTSSDEAQGGQSKNDKPHPLEVSVTKRRLDDRYANDPRHKSEGENRQDIKKQSPKSDHI
jgi:hypothetical protein